MKYKPQASQNRVCHERRKGIIMLFSDLKASGVVPIAERLMATLKSYEAEGQADPIYISCGITSAKKGEMTLEKLIAKADDLAYEAKHSGKNKIVMAE